MTDELAIEDPETIEPTLELIAEIISSKDVMKLLYVEEASWLEFHYDYPTKVPDPGGRIAKYELAKDCSAIANSGGGYLILGVNTKNINTRMTDYAHEIKGLEKSKFDLQSWKDSLASMLVPRFTIDDMEHGFLDVDSTKSVLYLKIPSAQDKGIYPILVQNDQWQSSEQHRIKGAALGVYERSGAENIMFSPEKTQSYLSQGVSNESVGQPYGQDLKRIEAKLDSLLDGSGTTMPIADVDNRRDRFIEIAKQKLGEDRNGFFYLYAAPKESFMIPNFWNSYSVDDSVPRLIKNPPTLRRMGWDLSVGDQEYPTAESDSWEIMNGVSKILEVTERGEVFAAGVFKRFIDWGLDTITSQSSEYDVLINEYALSEYIAMYFAFLDKFVASYADSPEDIRYQLRFGFVVDRDLRVGLNEPDMPGLPSIGTVGPLRSPSSWTIESCDPKKPDINAGFVIQEIMRSGFGSSSESSYFVRDDGILSFDRTSYK